MFQTFFRCIAQLSMGSKRVEINLIFLFLHCSPSNADDSKEEKNYKPYNCLQGKQQKFSK